MSNDDWQRLGAGLDGINCIYIGKFVVLLYSSFAGPGQIIGLLRAKDLEVVEPPLTNSGLASGILGANNLSFAYFARKDGSVALWDGTSGDQTLLRDIGLRVDDDLTLSEDNSLLLVNRSGEAVELWDLHTGVRRAIIPGERVKKVGFAIDGSVVFTLKEGGTLELWSLQGEPLGSIQGVGGEEVEVRMNNASCQAFIWTGEGQVLHVTRGWKVLGLGFVRRRACAQEAH